MIGIDPKECQVVSCSNRDYLSVIFRRCVLALIGTRVPDGTCFQSEMLEELVILTEQYVSSLCKHLYRLSSMQRRSQPSIGDVALMLRFAELNVVELARERELTAEIEETHPVSTLNSLYFDPSEADLPDVSIPFFQNHEQLVKTTRPWPQYMPSWMPPLPADHTYMHTPTHSSSIRDLRQVRLSLVEEGKLAEQALQRLLGDKGSRSIIEIGKPSRRDESVIVIDSSDVEGRAAREDLIDDAELSKQTISTPIDELSKPLPDESLKPSDSIDPLDTSVPLDIKSPSEPTASLDADVSSGPMASPDLVTGNSTTHTDTSAPREADTPPRPRLKLQLHVKPPASQNATLPSSPKSATQPEPAKKTEPKKLSLKLSINKPVKKSSISILGKRPHGLDIASLAKKTALKQQTEGDRMEDDEMQSGENNKDNSELSTFQAALASFVN